MKYNPYEKNTQYDQFGNRIDTTPAYINTKRVNVNYLPVHDENVTTWIRRIERASRELSDIQECHFDGSIRMFFCHKNPANCWVCDLNSIQSFFADTANKLIQIQEIEEILKTTYLMQQDDGTFKWTYYPSETKT